VGLFFTCLAAKRAGLHCVAVPSLLTRQLDTGLADLQIASLAEMTLEELVRKIKGLAERT
jgi:putative hydrolase of the HAD superfamily